MVPLEWLGSMALGAVLLLGSPGPAPLILASSGALLGTRRSLPLLVGLLAGLMLAVLGLLVAIQFGLSHWPPLQALLQWSSHALLLWIAYKVLAIRPASLSTHHTRWSFSFGVVFNLINPKVYVALLALIGPLWQLPSVTLLDMTLVAITIFAVALLVDGIWLWLGATFAAHLDSPKSQQRVRYVIASVIVLLVLFNVYRQFTN